MTDRPTKPSSDTLKTVLAGVAGFLLSWLLLAGFFAAILIGILVAGIAALVTGRIGTRLGDGGTSPVRPAPAPAPRVEAKPAAAPLAAAEVIAEDEAETRDPAAVTAPPPMVVEEAPVPAPVDAAPDPVAEGEALARVKADGETLAPSEALTPAPATADAMAASSGGPDLEIGTEERGEPAPGWLDGPRDGAGDDLKKIRGVGPKLAAQLNGMGIWHYDQIAAWGSEEVAWMDAHLTGFKGRVSRDGWVDQAEALARGQGA